MSGKIIDLTGKRYGRWTVLEQATPGTGYTTRWLCECDCGTVKTVDGQLLRTGKSRSCGCLNDERRLQMPKSKMSDEERLRAIYMSIRSACENPQDPKYPKLGGKGISVCSEWQASYDAFRNWSINHGYERGAYLLRYDVLQGFDQGNCKWTKTPDRKQGQGRKGSTMLTVNGETHSLAEWSRISGLHRSSIEERLLRGATPEEAVNPQRKPKGRKPRTKY